MRAIPAIPFAAIAGWSVCCALYAIVACAVFPGSVAHIIDVIYWDSFYTAWHALAFSVVILGTLALAPKLRSSVFSRSGFIAVGLFGGILTWPLGVIAWSEVMYGNVYGPWLIPSRGFDVPVACIVGLACTTLYGLFLGLYHIQARA